ncbi:hypothetical protein NC653_013943 [Populus alba x Populus x berolinensis]|uniref:Uncharacterized protein n=1 Tax=Populus alba x Populus x berolinensis TaxID=444605 RepID=A0AAD6QVU2_9ROSI|nr:hypothetical protein NC653_013943 [Populus alba x Populus x berolinensis]
MKIQLNFEFYFVRLLLRRIDALKQKAILQKLNWEVFILREEDYPCCFRYIQGYHEKGKDGLFYFACLCFIIALKTGSALAYVYLIDSKIGIMMLGRRRHDKHASKYLHFTLPGLRYCQ